MKPPAPEKVSVGIWVAGHVAEIAYDREHSFGRNTAPAVRFRLAVDGMKKPVATQWFTLSYRSGAKLLDIVLRPLVAGARTEMDFDLDELKGRRLMMFWSTNARGYEDLVEVRSVGEKLVPGNAAA